MAGVKIPDLNPIGTLANDDVFVVVDTSEDETKRISFGDLNTQTDSALNASNALVADKIEITANSDPVQKFVHFGSSNSGYDDVNVSGSLTYVPSNGTLTATRFNGDGSLLLGS